MHHPNYRQHQISILLTSETVGSLVDGCLGGSFATNPMSALGQKRTFCGVAFDVRFAPESGQNLYELKRLDHSDQAGQNRTN